MADAKNSRRWALPLTFAIGSGAGVAAAIFISVMVAVIVFSVVLVPMGWLLAARYGSHSHGVRDAEALGSNYEAIISMLSGALGLHDSMTLSNSTRVSMLAAVVAHEMRLPSAQIRLIAKAAIVHDIGKLGIAEAVLGKHGSLNEQDWFEMKRHPHLGYEILCSIDSLADSAEIVWAHHERFDGQGYPRNLVGDDIPIGARIFAVVDAYVAMTSGRPYRKMMGHAITVKEIVRNAITQFDPEVVQAFLSADRQGLVNGNPAADSPPQTADAPVPSEV